MNIYIGNLSYDVTGNDLEAVFSAYGAVDTTKIITDKYSGNSKGFGFVEMPDKNEAQAAIDGIKEIKGRQITINEARPKGRSNSRFPK